MMTIITFLKEHWTAICSASSVVSALIVFYTNLLTIRKLRLEIKKLKDAKDQERHRIISATEEQIERYGIRPYEHGIGITGIELSLREFIPMGLFISQKYWLVIMLSLSVATSVCSIIGIFEIFEIMLGLIILISIYYFLTYWLFQHCFRPRLEYMIYTLEKQKYETRKEA